MNRCDPRLDVVVFRTELGWMAAAGGAGLLCRLVFGHPSGSRALEAATAGLGSPWRKSDWCPSLVAMLVDYAAGAEVSFDHVELELSDRTAFQVRVVNALRQVPYGATISYGRLAARAGCQGGARAVGNCMAANRFPLIVPCHRVVNSDGSIGNFSAPQGIEMKRRLLDLEQPRGLQSGVSTRPRRAVIKRRGQAQFA